MTKAEWDKECKRIADAAWTKAHPPDKAAAAHTAAIAKQSEEVFQRFMERDAADKRARCSALVSHSLEGLANTLERWNATMGRFQAMG